MSDDVRQAAFIGSAINKNLGGIPTGKKKKLKNKNNKAAGTKATKATEPSTATDTFAKTSSTSKPALESPTEPVFVKSERIHKAIENPMSNQIEFNPNKGRQFGG